MLINKIHYHSISAPFCALEQMDNKKSDCSSVKIIDQRYLPFEVVQVELATVKEIVYAIKEMQIRGAPLIGITAAFGVYFACKESPAHNYDSYIEEKAKELINARPTAINLAYAVTRVLKDIAPVNDLKMKQKIALNTAIQMMAEDLKVCYNIGVQGLSIIEELSKKKKGETVNILTHCNAGWLACVDYGTATSPIYLAKEKGIKLHIWVDETRPRNQGARITSWELSENDIANTLITDNTGGLLMQNGMVDAVIVGTDRTTLAGDVTNKIGTYLKALAAKDNNIPFYVALPSSTIDWSIEESFEKNGERKYNVPIENRSDEEVKFVEGFINGKLDKILTTHTNAKVFNPGFDITPARLITALITEKGVCEPNPAGIKQLFAHR